MDTNNQQQRIDVAKQALAKVEAQTKPQTPKSEAAQVLTDADKREINKAVLTTHTGVMNPVEYEQQRKIANQFWQAGALPEVFKSAEQVFMAIQIGHSLGLTPHQSVNYGYYIKGKYNVYGQNVPYLIRKAGWRFTYTNETPDSCTVEMRNPKTGEAFSDTFTFDDAVKSNFTKDSYGKLKVGWLEGANRKRKMRYGVLSQVLHTYIPEVLGSAAGIAEYSEDYLEADAANRSSKQKELKSKAAAIAELPDEFTEPTEQVVAIDDNQQDNFSDEGEV